MSDEKEEAFPHTHTQRNKESEREKDRNWESQRPTIPWAHDWNIQFKSFSCEVLYVTHTYIRYCAPTFVLFRVALSIWFDFMESINFWNCKKLNLSPIERVYYYTRGKKPNVGHKIKKKNKGNGREEEQQKKRRQRCYWIFCDTYEYCIFLYFFSWNFRVFSVWSQSSTFVRIHTQLQVKLRSSKKRSRRRNECNKYITNEG